MFLIYSYRIYKSIVSVNMNNSASKMQTELNQLARQIACTPRTGGSNDMIDRREKVIEHLMKMLRKPLLNEKKLTLLRQEYESALDTLQELTSLEIKQGAHEDRQHDIMLFQEHINAMEAVLRRSEEKLNNMLADQEMLHQVLLGPIGFRDLNNPRNIIGGLDRLSLS